MVDYNQVESGELVKWNNVGTVVEGLLVNYEKRNTANGIGHVYEVRTKDGIVPFFAPQLLQKKLRDVPTGSLVRIEYTKETKTNGGNTLKHFSVGHAPASEANLKALGIDIMKPVGDDEDDGFGG